MMHWTLIAGALLLGANPPNEASAPSLCESAPATSASGLSVFSICQAPGATGGGNHLQLVAALQRIIDAHPGFGAFTSETMSLKGSQIQARLPANPSIGIQLEEFPGTGEYLRGDSAQLTFTARQSIALSDRRERHATIFESEIQSVKLGEKLFLIDLLSKSAEAYIEILGYQEHLEHASDAMTVIEKFNGAIKARIQSGLASPLELEQARASYAKAQMELSDAQTQLNAWRRVLSTQWGENSHGTFHASGDLDALPNQLPSIEEIQGQLSKSPQLREFELRRKTLQAQLAWQSASATPDLELGVGIRLHPGSLDASLVANATIALPFTDINAGNTVKTQAQIDGLRGAHESAEIILGRALALSDAKMRSAFARAQKHHNIILPAALKAHELLVSGFSKGRYSLIQVLMAQRELYEAIEHHHIALVDYHRARIQIEALLGAPLSIAANQSQQGKIKHD